MSAPFARFFISVGQSDDDGYKSNYRGLEIEMYPLRTPRAIGGGWGLFGIEQ